MTEPDQIEASIDQRVVPVALAQTFQEDGFNDPETRLASLRQSDTCYPFVGSFLPKIVQLDDRIRYLAQPIGKKR